MALERAGFADRGWTIHDWRHFSAYMWLYDRNVDPAIVSKAIGHASIIFTIDRYTRPRGEVIEALSRAGDCT
jgi:integrase